MIYSCFHSLVGVLFVGLIVTYIETAVSKSTDDWMVEMTNRQGAARDAGVSGEQGTQVGETQPPPRQDLLSLLWLLPPLCMFRPLRSRLRVLGRPAT